MDCDLVLISGNEYSQWIELADKYIIASLGTELPGREWIVIWYICYYIKL